MLRLSGCTSPAAAAAPHGAGVVYVCVCGGGAHVAGAWCSCGSSSIPSFVSGSRMRCVVRVCFGCVCFGCVWSCIPDSRQAGEILRAQVIIRLWRCICAYPCPARSCALCCCPSVWALHASVVLHVCSRVGALPTAAGAAAEAEDAICCDAHPVGVPPSPALDRCIGVGRLQPHRGCLPEAFACVAVDFAVQSAACVWGRWRCVPCWRLMRSGCDKCT